MFAIFFFQAEDGIRVHCVTGVQTCALPISISAAGLQGEQPLACWNNVGKGSRQAGSVTSDRKSTRLNSSHTVISYAVFCLKKKNTTTKATQTTRSSDDTNRRHPRNIPVRCATRRTTH